MKALFVGPFIGLLQPFAFRCVCVCVVLVFVMFCCFDVVVASVLTLCTKFFQLNGLVDKTKINIFFVTQCQI